jgi:thioredoxin reductase (NADPH)
MEAIGRDLREMLRVPLAPSNVATLLRAGVEVCYEAGDFLTQPGRPIDRFTYILEGEIEVVNAFTGGRLAPSTLGPAQFMAEIPLLSGGNWQMPMRAVIRTQVIEVRRLEMLR